MAGAGTVAGDGAVGSQLVEPLDEDDPSRLGPYLLLGRLGQGGMGTVYLGRREAGRPGGGHGEKGGSGENGDAPLVAVKMVRPDLAREPEFRERFGREATAARRVARFCTAEVLDVDVESRRPYLVTEYIEGRTLAAAVRQDGPLPSAEVERLAVAVASALTAIHAAGLVHRDLKPGNIMLSPSGARVIDFGIARTLDATTTFTHAGLGTPAFMAPEQALGGVVAPPADIYAWGGVVLYAATGRFPHGEGPSPAVLYRAVNEEPDLSGLEPGLRRLVARAMAKDPDRRPTAQELLLHLVGARPLDGFEDRPATAVDATPAELDEALTLAAEIARDFGDETLGAAGEAASEARGEAGHALDAIDAETTQPGSTGRSGARPPAALELPVAATSARAGDGEPATRDPTTVVPAHLRPRRGDADDGVRRADAEPPTGVPGRRRATRLFAGRRGAGGGSVHATSLGEPLAGHTGQVESVAFAPDGGTLASASADGTVRRWRLAGDPAGTDPATPLGEPSRGHEGRVLAVAYAPDAATLATAGSDHTVRLWPGSADGAEAADARAEADHGKGDDAKGDGPIATGLGHTDQVVGVAFSPRGRLLATASLDGTARLWELDPEAAGPAIRQWGQPLAGHQGKVLAVAFSPDGGLLATAGTDHTVLLWDLSAAVPGLVGPPLTGHRWHVQGLAFSRDGRVLVAGAGFGGVHLWNVTEPGRPDLLAQVTSRGNGQIRAVALSADGRALAAAGGIGAAVQLWALDDPARPRPLGQLATGHVGTVRALAFSPTSDILATAGDTTVRLWLPS